MSIIAQLLSPDFGWFWIEISKNALLSFVLSLPIAIVSKKAWPVVVAVFIGLFAIDIHGYFKILSLLGFDIQKLKGRTIVNSYGFELLLVIGIYIFYIFKVRKVRELVENWKIKEKFSFLIISVACGFQANLFVDTTIANQPIYYEPLTSLLRHFGKVSFENIPIFLLGLYMVIFLLEICLFSWEYWYQKKQFSRVT